MGIRVWSRGEIFSKKINKNWQDVLQSLMKVYGCLKNLTEIPVSLRYTDCDCEDCVVKTLLNIGHFKKISEMKVGVDQLCTTLFGVQV